MKSIRNIILLLSVITLSPFLFSCCTDYQTDIDRLCDIHSDLERRVTNLESQVSTINKQLEQLSVLSSAVEQNFYVSDVTSTADGYKLTLSNGQVFYLQNAPGNRLVPTPAISMTQVNGLFYWTVNGLLLTDDAGKPIRTRDLTPVVKYDFTSEQWLISIDGGTTFQTISAFASVIINDEVLVQVINSYFREHSTTFVSQEMLYQIISTYIQRNYAELFNINILDEVVAGYIDKNYTKIFSYELLEKIFNQYDFAYYTSQIEVDKLVNLIITFIREDQRIFENDEVLREILFNYIEVNKTTIFTSDMLVDIINNFVQNHADYINVELLTQIVGNYIDEHRDVVFNTDVVKNMLMQYLKKYYVQVFSQNILVRLLNIYVSQNTTTIFNETLIREIINTYVENNHTAIFSQEVIREIVNNYLKVNATAVFNRDTLVEVITNYFRQNYNLFIEKTTIETIIRTYVEEHHTTIISVDIIEAIVYNYLTQYYSEVFDQKILNQIIVNYFENNEQVIAKYVGEYAAVVRDVKVVDDRCDVTLGNGKVISLVVYDAFASLRDRVQSIVVMPNADGHVSETKGDGNNGYLYLKYMVTPAGMAEVIMQKFYDNEFTLEMKLVDEMGNISTFPAYEPQVYDRGVLQISCMTPNYGLYKNVAFYVKDVKKIGGTDFMTEFTPIGAETKKGYPDCPDDNHPHMIDLGLPSGTLWACCNIGAHEPEGYGSYFAWGETYTKEKYDFDSYTLGNSWDEMINIGDDIAGTQYDAATVRWGSAWRMPTDEQINELINNTKHGFGSKNNVKGCYFWGFYSGVLFLPAAGTYSWTNLYAAGITGTYWSSMLSKSDASDHSQNYANILTFNQSQCTLGKHYDFGFRQNGNTIRPVAAP